MAKRSVSVGWRDWATRLFAPAGVMIVMAAAAALVVAGVYTADIFAGGLGPAELARHHGVAAATAAWAVPLGLAGIATLFIGIAAALSRIRIDIRARRDALVYALPRVLHPTN